MAQLRSRAWAPVWALPLAWMRVRVRVRVRVRAKTVRLPVVWSALLATILRQMQAAVKCYATATTLRATVSGLCHISLLAHPVAQAEGAAVHMV